MFKYNIFSLKVMKGWMRILHNEKLRNLYFSSGTVVRL
jgi:hypothetical protein